jgi:hypothetical protein
MQAERIKLLQRRQDSSLEHSQLARYKQQISALLDTQAELEQVCLKYEYALEFLQRDNDQLTRQLRLLSSQNSRYEEEQLALHSKISQLELSL